MSVTVSQHVQDYYICCDAEMYVVGHFDLSQRAEFKYFHTALPENVFITAF